MLEFDFRYLSKAATVQGQLQYQHIVAFFHLPLGMTGQWGVAGDFPLV